MVQKRSLICSQEQLEQALAGLGEADQELLKRLGIFTELLDKWSRAQRLVGWRDAESLLHEGLLDAWAAVPLLDQSSPRPVIDLGSGAGLPGLIFAAARPSREFHLIEARRKRASFLTAAARAMGLEQVQVHRARWEQLFEEGKVPLRGLVTARAFAPPAAVLGAATRLQAQQVLLSVATQAQPPASVGNWSEVARRPGAPSDRRVHMLLGILGA